MGKKRYAVIGYGSGVGGRVAGAKLAPQAVRDLGIIKRLEACGVDIDDLGDVDSDTSGDDSQQILAQASESEKRANEFPAVYSACRRLYRKTLLALEQDSLPLVVGGSHCSSMGSVAAVADYYARKKQSIGLIWVDTHPDINSPETSLSGNLHGMSVAFLLGRIDGAMKQLCQHAPAVSSQNLAYIGLRDVDPAERQLINDCSIAAYSMKDVDIVGVAQIVQQAIDVASNGTAGFVVSFDLDVCDPSLVPGTGTPIRGGLTFREAHLVLELLHDSGKMLGLEIVELNPTLDEDQKTTELAISLAESGVGKSIL